VEVAFPAKRVSFAFRFACFVSKKKHGRVKRLSNLPNYVK
jgi:hypothetical protein